MITHNTDFKFQADVMHRPESATALGLCVHNNVDQLWLTADELRDVSGSFVDVPAQTFKEQGELHAYWSTATRNSAAPFWDNRRGWGGWESSTVGAVKGTRYRVEFSLQSNNTYRSDFRYATRQNERTLHLPADTRVLAMKCRLIPESAVITWDVVDANNKTINTKECSGARSLSDGWTLLYCDCSAWPEDSWPLIVLQIKIADIIEADYNQSNGYEVAWLGAFSSVDQAAEWFHPKDSMLVPFNGGRVWVGTGGHWRRRHAEDFKAAAEAARRELEDAAVELDMARDELDKTRGELDTARAEIAGKDAEIAELSTREPADYWLDAMERGRHVAQWLTANFKDCGYWGFTSCGWNKASQIEAALGLDKPWVMPPITLPSSPEGKAGTLGATFVKCGNMLYCYPIKIEEGCTLEQTFHSCVRLTRAPEIDTSKVRNFSGCFYGCGRITDWPDWDFSEAVNMASFFQAPMLEVDGPPAGGVVETREVWLPNATTLRWAFNEHRNLRRLGRIHAPKCSNLRLFNTPNVLERIDGLDLDAQTENAFASGYQRPLCKYIMLYNLGKCSTPGQQYLYYYPNWGKDSDENRQSLVDSLLTNSYDRVAAGLEEPYEIILDPATTARLTAEEIAAITAKGFTITSQKY